MEKMEKAHLNSSRDIRHFLAVESDNWELKDISDERNILSCPQNNKHSLLPGLRPDTDSQSPTCCSLSLCVTTTHSAVSTLGGQGVRLQHQECQDIT